MDTQKKPRKTGFYISIRNTFLRYAAVPILILTLLWGVGVYAYGLFAVQRANTQVNDQIVDLLAEQYTNYCEMLMDASELDSLQKVLREIPDANCLAKASETLYTFNNKQNIHSIFYLFNPYGRLMVSNTWEDRSAVRLNTLLAGYAEDIIRQMPAGEVYHQTTRRQTPGGRNTVFALAAPLYDGGQYSGCLVFQLLERDFQLLVSAKEVNYTVITDPFQNTIVSNNEHILGPISKFIPPATRRGEVEMDGVKTYFNFGQTPDSLFNVYTMTSLSVQRQMILFGFAFILVSSVLFIVLMVYVSHRVADKNTIYLEELVQTVDAMRTGNYVPQVSTDPGRADEFRYLSSQYQQLSKRIGYLLQVNQELAEVQKQTEMKHLQAQFHPHFIFNVLETIKYEMYVETDLAARIVNLLARLLRYSISGEGGDTMVTLGHDMEYIQAYLDLQKIRYDERLTFSITIPEMLRQCKLPKLIVQPLVENCIAHGYQQKEYLDITITGTLEGGCIQLRVTDNGDGILPEKLAKIRSTLQGGGLPNQTQNNDIGLYNSHRRLQLMFGSNYGLEISSILGIGTEVMLTFPFVVQEKGIEDV